MGPRALSGRTCTGNPSFEVITMVTPWEVFSVELQQRTVAELPPQAVLGAEQRERIAGAIRDAGRATREYLRYEMEWSFVHSAILTGRFLEAAEEWIREEAPDTGELRARLRRVWHAAREIRLLEEERRRVTEAVVSGSAAPLTAGTARRAEEWNHPPLRAHARAALAAPTAH